MNIKTFLLLFLVQSVISEECVPYNFENDFESLFTRSRFCTTLAVQGDWISGRYTSILEEPTNNLSTTFISPALPNTLSCTTSFVFEMSSGSEFEIHVYLESELSSDGLNVFVNQVIDDINVLTLIVNPLLAEYQPGWNIITGNLEGTGTFEGYVTIMGMVSTDAVLLVDAFRYIPTASLDDIEDNEECIIYRAVEDNTEEESGGTEDSSNQTDENGGPEDGSNQTEENGETEDSSNQTDENGGPEDGSNGTDESEETEDGSNQTEENGETEDSSNQTDENGGPEDESNGTDESEETEDGSNQTEENGETEDSSNQTDENGNTEETEDGSDETEESDETENGSSETEEDTSEPATEDPNEYSFWNALTITMTVLVSLILLSIICFVCYECGKRRARDKVPLIFADVETPTPTLVPRVTKVYPEHNTMYSLSSN